jgi:hypothetical protein
VPNPLSHTIDRADRTVVRRALTASATGVLTALALVVPASQSVAATTTVATQAQLTQAVSSAKPGDVIALKAGTYSGGISITRSGTAAAPITLTAAGNGPVVLTKSLRMPSCSAVSPDSDRTVRISQGASHWTIDGLSIRGGVMIMGGNSGEAKKWFGQLIDDENWQARRAVPGRGKNDPVAARSAISYLENKTGDDLSPSDGIRLTDNVITVKGIHSAMNRYGTISGNTITDIACGTGPGVWLGNYSDGWKITDNRLSRIATSSAKHFMQEGIRVGGASNYNLIQGNVITDLPKGGRAFTTDQDASYNTFTRNVATNVDMGFNEQMSGWGNVWSYNTVTGYRVQGFSFRSMDSNLSQPSMDSASYQAVVRCNKASGTGAALRIGGTKSATYQSNSFPTLDLAAVVVRYWGAQGNTWNGSSKAPSARPAITMSGC